MKTNVQLLVTLQFSDPIEEDDIYRVAMKVKNALIREIDNGEGIAPDECFTTGIYISAPDAADNFQLVHEF